MYPINDLPKDMPDIPMKNLSDDQLEDLRHISLADVIKEARCRIKEAQIQASAARIVARLTSAKNTGASSPTTIVDAPTPEQPCDSDTCTQNQM